MIGMMVIFVALVAPNGELTGTQSALDACRRMAAAAAVDPTGATPEERAARRARLAELEALLTYIEKTHKVLAVGYWNSAYHHNYLQVTRQLVAAGADLAVLPEETLCWQRIGLTLSFNHYHLIQSQARAGVDATRELNQARTQFELFRTQYRTALAKAIPLPN